MSSIGITSILGPAVQVTATATNKRNATALPPGKYLLHVGSDTGTTGIRLIFGSSSIDVTATGVAGMLLGVGDYLEFVIPADPALQYLAIIRDSGGATNTTVYIAGNDNETAKSTPPAWS